MEFREYLNQRKMSAYRLCNKSGVPYSCISDLCLNKTTTRNLSLGNACKIADALGIRPEELLDYKQENNTPLRYFRNNLLHELKRLGDALFVDEMIRRREIDVYFKSGDTAKALYLLALVDYLCVSLNRQIYRKRYNRLRGLRLDTLRFVGGETMTFRSIEDAEKKLGRPVIAEFAKYNIIEVDIRDVA